MRRCRRLHGAIRTDANVRKTSELRLGPAGLEAVARETEGFSFAHLKELCLASVMAWMNASGEATMDAVALDQARLLDAQYRTAPEADDSQPAELTRAERVREALRDDK